ncbi:MAG: radical SAM protein [Pseudomonadota bacterium]
MDRPLTAPRVLALMPPMTQLNVPYPATAYLTGFLRSRGVAAFQADLAIELVLRLFSRAGLADLARHVETQPARERTPRAQAFLDRLDRHLACVEPAVAFLQGRDPSLAMRIAGRRFLPEGPRFESLDVYYDPEGGDPLAWAFGALGVQDRARHLATLYLDDLADVLREGADPRFEFVRYGESLSMSQPSFEPLAHALAAPPTLVERHLDVLVDQVLERYSPRVVLISAPFPGNVYAAFRMARRVKDRQPDTVTVLGGGYVNTELRDLAEPRVFDFFDFVCLDDGERPLLALLEHLAGKRALDGLVRTFVRDAGPDDAAAESPPPPLCERGEKGPGTVRFIQGSEADVPFNEVGTPTWDGLPLDRYLSLLDMLNPMHRLWSDGGWNKLTVAHGCYWKKCSFCDVGLDYIGRYDAASAAVLVDRIEAVVAETGRSGFHFVDEAAPPKALKALAEELARRGRAISWWGNIRFEKSFTPALCRQLADSGCVAVSGGLEVASDRLLQLMQKGVSVEQVARVTHAFSEAGILVHAYLMYGFPSQTVQDTVDALEYVRQLFAAGCIQSGFFHRFACTVHSPVGLEPERYGIRLKPRPFAGFARNDVAFSDPTGTDHDALGQALNKALYNFMHGIGLEQDVRRWFDVRVPKPKVARNFIERALGG